MRRFLLIAALTAAGCGNAPAPPATPVAAATNEPAAAQEPGTVQDALAGLEAEVSGMDLYMHDLEPTGDTRRKPTLWVHAAKASKEADNSWALADATAVIYREQDADITLESKAGRFDEGKKMAVLEGSVRVVAGGMSLETESITYDNTLRRVESTAPVHLTDGATQLTAERATLEPEFGEVTLTNVSGTLSLAGELE